MAIEQASTKCHCHEVIETAVDGTADPGKHPLIVGDIPAIVQQVSTAITNQTENGDPPAPAQTWLRNALHSASEEEGRQPPPATTTCQDDKTTTQQSLTLGDMLSLVDAVVN